MRNFSIGELYVAERAADHIRKFGWNEQGETEKDIRLMENGHRLMVHVMDDQRRVYAIHIEGTNYSKVIKKS